jgi:hypothetical protein
MNGEASRQDFFRTRLYTFRTMSCKDFLVYHCAYVFPSSVPIDEHTCFRLNGRQQSAGLGGCTRRRSMIFAFYSKRSKNEPL